MEGDRREEPMSQLHNAGRGRRSMGSEISSNGKVEFSIWTNRFGGVVLAAAILTPAADFFLDFPAVPLGAAVDLGSGFLGLAVSLVAVTLGCSGAFNSGWNFGLFLYRIFAAQPTLPLLSWNIC